MRSNWSVEGLPDDAEEDDEEFFSGESSEEESDSEEEEEGGISLAKPVFISRVEREKMLQQNVPIESALEHGV